MPLSPTEAAYLAGILDGEGCISFGSRGKYMTPTVQVSNTNFLIIAWLSERYPKSTFYNTGEKRPNRKPCYMWRCAGQQAREVLKDALPYLLLKKPQAELVFKLPNFRGKHMTSTDFDHNKDLLTAMRTMNKRGIPHAIN